ncbi:MAG: hypothetical protein L7U72_14190 [Rubripirellula sp.]|nr:hypothetical protein [Rubripirellula sp.]
MTLTPPSWITRIRNMIDRFFPQIINLDELIAADPREAIHPNQRRTFLIISLNRQGHNVDVTKHFPARFIVKHFHARISLLQRSAGSKEEGGNSGSETKLSGDIEG